MAEGRRKPFSRKGLPNSERLAIREDILHALSVLNMYDETGPGFDEVFHALNYLEWLLCKEGKLQQSDRTARDHRYDCSYDRYQLFSVPYTVGELAKKISGTGHKAEEEIGEHLSKGAKLLKDSVQENILADLERIAEKDD